MEGDYVDLILAKDLNKRSQMHHDTASAKISITKKSQNLSMVLDELKHQYAERLGLKKPQFDREEDQELKNKNIERISIEFFESIVQIQVTFLSMKTKSLAEQIFFSSQPSKLLRRRFDKAQTMEQIDLRQDEDLYLHGMN